MPSSVIRTCAPFSVWILKLTSVLTRYFRPRAPELPVSTLDGGCPETWKGLLHEQLVLSPRNLPPQFQDVRSFKSDPVQESPEIGFVSQSPQSTPLLIRMSPPVFSSPQLGSDESVAQTSTGGLGQRRGFKGAPLSTRKPSFLSLSSALGPLSPPSLPSTPRSPLVTVTNLIRAGKSPIKPRTGADLDPPIPDEVQQCYELGDPFSVTAESFYTPEALCSSIPFSNLRVVALNALPARRIVDSVSLTTRATHIYDLMVYNFQPQSRAKKCGKNKVQSPVPFAPKYIRTSDVTAACPRFPYEEPPVCLPRDFRRDCEVSAVHDESYPVVLDFARTCAPISSGPSQTIPINIPIRDSTVDNMPTPRCSSVQLPAALVDVPHLFV